MTRNAVLLDAGPMIALFNRDDQYHENTVKFIRERNRKWLTTWPVVTEAAHTLGYSVAAQLDLLRWIRGSITVVDLTVTDLNQILEVMEKYDDLPSDLGDASLVAIADRLGIRDVATYDSDFRVYRYCRRQRFRLLLLDK